MVSLYALSLKKARNFAQVLFPLVKDLGACRRTTYSYVCYPNPSVHRSFVLAATDHLRHKLTRMEARMHSLEDALAITYSSESDRVHPLLSVAEASADAEEDASQLRPISEETAQSHVPLREALGTLWLDKEGSARFFGPSGSSEVRPF